MIIKRILFCAWTLGLSVALAGAQTTDKVIDIKTYGATGDGKTLDTEAIQRALDECGQAGGGMVRIPPGKYLSKPITLRANTRLEIQDGAVLQARDLPEDFESGERGLSAFINARDVNNIAITGGGAVDGAGFRWWQPVREAKKLGEQDKTRRPRLIVLSHCQNVLVEGVTLRNSPSFHLVPSDCENVVITNVSFLAPGNSPNTDAMDPSACKNVLITRCVVSVGDDNIAIKSGHKVNGREAACEDFVVSDCTFLKGHGMSIGSETSGGVRNLLVTNCVFDGTTSGIRIKTSRERGGTVEDCVYANITMTNVATPVNITCYYPKVPDMDEAQAVTANTPIFRNIIIKDLVSYNDRGAGMVVGLPEMCVSNVLFQNVKFVCGKGFLFRNAKGIQFTNAVVTPANGPAFSSENAEVTGLDAGGQAKN
jgi:polygalacturonase